MSADLHETAIMMVAVRAQRQRRECEGELVEQDNEMGIAEWRAKIDDLDEQIVRLISERAVAARAIGELKRVSALPVYEPKREQAVFNHVRSLNPGPLGDAELMHVYERIMDVMRTLQRRDVQ